MFYMCIIVTILSSHEPFTRTQCASVTEAVLLQEMNVCLKIDAADPVTSCGVTKVTERTFDFHVTTVR